MEDNNNQNNQNGQNENGNQSAQFQLELKPEVAGGQYCNFALINHSHSDFVLDFARIMPGMPKPEVVSRVILAPEHAKRLLAALQENIFKYEQEFGKIVVPGQERTIAPFGTRKGQA